jgi:hypothetical protein
MESDSILMGCIFDDRGNRMTPTYAVKNGVRYRYYISAPLIQGQSDKAAKLNRMAAVEIEKLVIGAVRKHLGTRLRNEMEAESPISLTDKELISTYIARVDVKQDHLAIQLAVLFETQSGMQNRRRSKDHKNGNDQSRSVDRGELGHCNPNILVVP